MISQIQFLKMDRSEAVENFVADELEALQGHMSTHREAHFKVWLESVYSQVHAGKNTFRCAIEVDGLKRKQFFVEKKDANFYRAFHLCMDALDKIFRRDKKTALKKQRRERDKFVLAAEAVEA